MHLKIHDSPSSVSLKTKHRPTRGETKPRQCGVTKTRSVLLGGGKPVVVSHAAKRAREINTDAPQLRT